jgi:hypothetical protein
MAIEAGNLCLQGMVLKPLNRVSRNNLKEKMVLFHCFMNRNELVMNFFY